MPGKGQVIGERTPFVTELVSYMGTRTALACAIFSLDYRLINQTLEESVMGHTSWVERWHPDSGSLGICVIARPERHLSRLLYPYPNIAMIYKKDSGRYQRRVWRTSAAMPLGEYVGIDDIFGSQATERQVSDGPTEPNWQASSFDLARGLEVTEMRSKVSAEELDKLFKS